MTREEWLASTRTVRRSFAFGGRTCIEPDCTEPAGTPWTRHWCADHDDARIARISAQLAAIQADRG